MSHPAPKPTTTVPAVDLAGRPDLIEKEGSTADAPARKRVGDITHTFLTREEFAYPAGRDRGRSARRKDCWLRPQQGHMRTDPPPQRPEEVEVRNCQPIKGVTIFFMSNPGNTSARPLTTPPP